MLNNNDEFVFLSALHQFKKFKIKSISHINISNEENNKFSLSFNEFQFLTKNVDFCRNDLTIARPTFKKFIKDQNQIEDVINDYVISIQFDDDYNQIDKNEKLIKIEIFDFDKL